MTDGKRFSLRVWRQRNPADRGRLVTYKAEGISPDMSFLEMLDLVNQRLAEDGEEPIAFDSDCREGICGTCALVINGIPHGPGRGTCTCQLYMRSFADGSRITVEPWRAAAFPVVRDLVVDRSSLDRIMQAGGYASIDTGSAPEANNLLVPQTTAEAAFDAAACIGCGACVAACRNASAMLFLAAKVKHLAVLPQGHPERERRVTAMLERMEQEGFGNCTNEYECEAACPKLISVEHIAFLNREFLRAKLRGKRQATGPARPPRAPSRWRPRRSGEGRPD